LAKSEVVIVSGLTLDTDAAEHRGAIMSEYGPPTDSHKYQSFWREIASLAAFLTQYLWW
jgi:hypothetical protein